uniref:Leucine rich repeat and fibronectin type III domain containing 2 n=1 Tax=Pseudonaja textilis TaxID=8673 RepID=A0A670ZQ95_PSETE
LRMIPPTSKGFLMKDLAAGRGYHLCVLAIYDDGVTSLTVTQSLGCLRFSTLRDGLQCHALHTQFLGGTMIIVVGGIIVASVLVFIILLMIRYKASSGRPEEPEKKAARVSNVYSQTNGSHPPAGPPPTHLPLPWGGEDPGVSPRPFGPLSTGLSSRPVFYKVLLFF